MPKHDAIAKLASFFALLLLAFAAGMAVAHYKTWPYSLFINAAQGGEAWEEKRFMEKLEAAQLKRPVPRDRPLGQTVNKLDKSTAGYTLVSVAKKPVVRVLDANGQGVFQWSLPYDKAFPKPVGQCPQEKIHWTAARPFPGGDLIALYECDLYTPPGNGLVRLDRYSRPVWAARVAAHHDFDITASGDIVTPTNSRINKPFPDYPKIVPPVLADNVALLSPTGELLKEVPLLEAFARSSYRELVTRAMAPNARFGDYLHLNSVHVLTPALAEKFPQFKPGQVLLSMREVHMLAVLDMDAQEIVWAMQGAWKRQHHARFEPDGSISLYDNSGLLPAKQSRILKIRPEDGKILWSSEGGAPFFSSIRGSHQFLPNGHLFVVQSVGGRLLELDAKKQLVWEYFAPYDNEPNTSNPLPIGARYSHEDLPFLSAP